MTPRKKYLALIIIFIFISLFSFAGSKSSGIIRYGLIIGTNDGGPDRTRLQYATSDAQSFAEVMQEMGGLSPGNNLILFNPDIDSIEHALTALKRIIVNQKKSKMRQEFIFYYSGHSDEDGLLIGTEKISYKKLRLLIDSVPSDVRIAIIDSCASGIFIRAKGGVKRAPFMIDSSTEMKGYAFLTSSSENEAAQESDRIKASFFTHYLISGLRGAADVTQDEVVTLNEAYYYTFKETLARTEKTQHGPQHPSYDIQLSGTGDLVLTDLRQVSASLVIEEKIAGIIYIRTSRGDLVVELNKEAKNKMEIGLSPGNYLITLDANSTYYEAEVTLSKGQKTNLLANAFRKVSTDFTQKRGDEDVKPRLEGGYSYEYNPFSFSVIPNFPFTKKENTLVKTTVSFSLTIGVDDMIEACALSVLGSTVLYDMHGFQASGIYNIVWGDTVGASLSGVFNMAYGNINGLQASGVFNYTYGLIEGVQASGVFNKAEDVNGAQLSGGLNLGKKVQGAQVGLVNIAQKIEGVQVGLVNIAEENNGVALGLFNYSKNGILNFEIWQEWDSLSYFGFKFGTPNFYTILVAGYDLIAASDRWSLGIGWGLHLPIHDAFLDIDALCSSIYSSEKRIEHYNFSETLLPQLRIKAGYHFFSTLGIFAGVNLQIFIPHLYYDKSFIDYSLLSIPVRYSDDEIEIVPRVFFGIQLLK